MTKTSVGGVGVGGEGREGRWKNDDYHMYHGHDDRLRVLGAFSVFPTSGPTSGLLNTSHLDELTQLEDSANPRGWFERNKC